MSKDYFVWGSGVKEDSTNKTLRQKHYELLQSSGWGKSIDNVYVKDDCILYIVKGELFKEGLFNFEKTEHKNKTEEKFEREQIVLQSNSGSVKDYVIDLAIGENHVLIQTLQGKVYSWGDNYYGQLGLGNCFVAKVFEPHQVKINEVKKIFAYKNNSFAIDVFNKLWVWGKSEFLGTNFKGNAFKPMQVLSQYCLENFKINDDRIIIQVVEDSKHGRFAQEEEEGANKEEGTLQTETSGKYTPNPQVKGHTNNPHTNPDKVDNSIHKEEEIKNQEEVVDVETIKIKNKAKDETNIDRANVLMMKVVKKLNEDISECLRRLSSEDRVLTDIRTKILSDKMTVKGLGLDQIWNDINNILTQSVKMNKSVRTGLLQNANNISLGDTIEVFSYVMNTMITGKINEQNVNKLVENFSSYEKETAKVIADIKLDEMIKDETVNAFAKNIQTLLTYFIKYKKIEMLCHKMSAHQFLLKSFRFENVLEALNFIMQKDENVEKKLYLIEKSFESLKLLIEKVNISLQGLEDTFGILGKLNFQNTDILVEKFIYKHIIESTIQIRDLWTLLISHVESHRIAKEKENQMLGVLDAYKEMHSIQMYLNSLSLKTLFFTENKSDPKAKKEVTMKEIKNRVINLMTDVDGAINKLKTILKENYETKEKQMDNYSKVSA